MVSEEMANHCLLYKDILLYYIEMCFMEKILMQPWSLKTWAITVCFVRALYYIMMNILKKSAIMITEEVGDHCLFHKGMLNHVTTTGQ